MSIPSKKAIEVATKALVRFETDEDRPPVFEDSQARAALEAAHDPSLGLDRSVCLRDVVITLGRLEGPEEPPVWEVWEVADWIVSEFGVKS